MGYAHYTDSRGRAAGYGVGAHCDLGGCMERIDRGLDYRCGSVPTEDFGCGKFFCASHRDGNSLCPECAASVPTCDECGCPVDEGVKVCDSCQKENR